MRTLFDLLLDQVDSDRTGYRRGVCASGPSVDQPAYMKLAGYRREIHHKGVGLEGAKPLVLPVR